MIPFVLLVFALGFLAGDRRRLTRALTTRTTRPIRHHRAMVWLANAPCTSRGGVASGFEGDRECWDASRVRIAPQAGAEP